MRYTRFEFKGQSPIDFKKFILLFVIIIPLIGVIFGFAVSKFFIVPHILKLIWK